MDKNDPRFDVVLSMDDPSFADKFLAAIGANKGDTIQFVTPQFERADKRVVSYIPKSVAEYDALKTLNKEARKALGMGAWGEIPEGAADAKVLWLFPKEWYSAIPDGTEVVDINGETELFRPGETDDDYRFGCLAYGFFYERDAT